MYITSEEKASLKTYFTKNFLTLEFDSKTPKSRADGTSSEWDQRYEGYKSATNTNQFIEMGGTIPDLIHNFEYGRVYNLRLVEKNIKPLHEEITNNMSSRKIDQNKAKAEEKDKQKNEVDEQNHYLRENISSLKNELDVMKERALRAEKKLSQIKLHTEILTKYIHNTPKINP